MIARLAMMGLVLGTVLLLETVVFPELAIAGWRPSLVVLSVVAFGLADGPETGMRYGFVAGLVGDLLAGGGQLVGMSALVYLLVGYGAGLSRPYLAGHAISGVLIVAGVASVLSVVLSGLLSVLLDADAPRGLSVFEAAIVVGIYNCLLSPFVYRPIAALTRRFTGNPLVG